MKLHALTGARRFKPFACLTAALVLALLSGCITAHPDPAAEQSIAQATGLADAIVFRVEAGPLDEADTAPDALGIGEAVRRAVTTDPGLQAALARVRIAKADADQSRLLPNPVLNFVLRWGPGWGGKPQIEVGLAEDLIRIFRIPRQSSAADNRLRQSAADAVTMALDVVADVQERYAAVQTSDRLLPLLEGRLELLRRLNEVARNRLEGGEGVRNDVTTLDAQRVELEVEIAEVGLRRREERLRLARLIGEPSGGAAWKLDEWASPAVGASAEDAWIDAALKHRPEVQSVAWRLAALGDEYALTRLFPWEGAGVGVQAQRGDGWFTGPLVSSPMPIFDMGQARKARVTAEQIEARHSLTMSSRTVVEEVRVAHQALAGNLANLDRVRKELIPLQQQRRDQAEQAFRGGQTDVTPLFLAEQDLRATQAKAIDIERQATVALIRLQRAVGGPGIAAEISSAPKAVSQAAPSTQPLQR